MDGVELIVRDYGMSVSKTGPEVIRFQIRVVREDCLRSFPLSEQTENEFDGDAHASNDGLTTKNLVVHCYASKKGLVDHSYWCFPFLRTFCSPGYCRFKEASRSRFRGHPIPDKSSLQKIEATYAGGLFFDS